MAQRKPKIKAEQLLHGSIKEAVEAAKAEAAQQAFQEQDTQMSPCPVCGLQHGQGEYCCQANQQAHDEKVEYNCALEKKVKTYFPDVTAEDLQWIFNSQFADLLLDDAATRLPGVDASRADAHFYTTHTQATGREIRSSVPAICT
tara:strand:- start:178 stop:612 length:435 start_codon:yes stop_codon:yes gene_type:complete